MPFLMLFSLLYTKAIRFQFRLYWSCWSGALLFFTVYFGFPNIRFFGKAINVVRGKYDLVDHGVAEAMYGDSTPGGDAIETIKDESADGEVSHFQALATAVSGTVGNGNIAGVALAIALGGPGATFWMIVCGLVRDVD